METLLISEKTIWIPNGNEYETYEIRNIYYCESKNQYTIFHIEDGKEKPKAVVSSKGIGEWEKDLEKYHFCRIHSQTLVNLRHVKKYINGEGGIVVLVNNQNLTVSKSKKQRFLTSSGIK